MLFYIGKVLLLFVLTIIVIRFLGKSAMAQLTPHDLTAIVFLVTIAVSPVANDKVEHAIAGILVVTVVHILFSRLTLFQKLNTLLIGKPTILIKNGKIIKSNLSKNRYPLMELLSSLRAAGYPDIKDIQYTILEPNGEISIIPKESVVSVTPRHLNISVENRGIPISVVIEGKIQYHNLELIHKDEQWLRKRLEECGYPQLDTIFYAAVRDTDHSLMVDTGTGA